MKKTILLTISLISSTASFGLTVDEALKQGICYKLKGYQPQAQCYDQHFKDSDTPFARAYKAERQRVINEKTPKWLRTYMESEAKRPEVKTEEKVVEAANEPAPEVAQTDSQEQTRQQKEPQEEAKAAPVPAEVVRGELQQFREGHAKTQDLLDLQQEAFTRFRQNANAEQPKSKRVELLSDAYLATAMERSTHGQSEQLTSREPVLTNTENDMGASIVQMRTQGISDEQITDALIAEASSEEVKNDEVRGYQVLMAINQMREASSEENPALEQTRTTLMRQLGIDPNDLPEQASEKIPEEIADNKRQARDANDKSNDDYFSDSDMLMDADLLEAPTEFGEVETAKVDIIEADRDESDERDIYDITQGREDGDFSDEELTTPARVMAR